MVRVLPVALASLLLAAASDRSVAEVVFTGTVTPGTPQQVTPQTDLIVGLSDNGQGTEDPRGAVEVDGGSLLEAARLWVGDGSQALASAHVRGLGSRIQLVSQGNEYTPTLAVGRQGTGYLGVSDGGWVSVGSLNGRTGVMTVGAIEGAGHATAEVRGESSLLTVGRRLIVGGGVDPSLFIADGGVVQIGQEGLGLYGSLEVTGRRSELQTNGLIIGRDFQDNGPAGPAELLVRDHAVVRPYLNQGFDSEATIGFDGSLVLDGGTFALPIDRVLGSLRGSGALTGGVNIDAGGVARADEGDRLEFYDTVQSSGLVRATDGRIDVRGRFVNRDVGEFDGAARFTRSEVNLLGGLENSGSIHLTDSELHLADSLSGQPSFQNDELIAVRSRLEFDTGVENSGRLELIDSTLALNSFRSFSIFGQGRDGTGRLVMDGSVIETSINAGCCGNAIANGGVIEARSGHSSIRVAIEDNGSGSLLIGSNASADLLSANFYGGVSAAADGVARFEGEVNVSDVSLVLTNANRDRATFVAAGLSEFQDASFSVNGRLIVEAEGLAGVEAEQVFKLIEAEQLFGDFSEYALPELPGALEFLPEFTDTSLSLRVIDTAVELPGDFNADGRVDAADYTLWRDGLPGGSRWLDRELWTNNYGRALAGQATSDNATSVPEPATLAPMLIALLCGSRLGRSAEVG